MATSETHDRAPEEIGAAPAAGAHVGAVVGLPIALDAEDRKSPGEVARLLADTGV